MGTRMSSPLWEIFLHQVQGRLYHYGKDVIIRCGGDIPTMREMSFSGAGMASLLSGDHQVQGWLLYYGETSSSDFTVLGKYHYQVQG